jgi:hypothetical protein
MAWDQAIMFPMLEMSGHRARFISEVLYIYNAANPISDHKLDRELQRNLETAIRAQRRYHRLTEPATAFGSRRVPPRQRLIKFEA